MGKFEIFGIFMIILAVSIPVIIAVGVTDMKEWHDETCIILDKYEDEYTTIQPMPMGKAGIMTVPIKHHDYYFNTTKGVIPVNSKLYNSYNVSDTLNIRVNSNGMIREILN